jgi:hypothetical protein
VHTFLATLVSSADCYQSLRRQREERPGWNDIVDDSGGGSGGGTFGDPPPVGRSARVTSGRRSGQPTPQSSRAYSPAPSPALLPEPDQGYTAQVAAQAAPKLTLLKAKLQRTRSKGDLNGDDGAGGYAAGPSAGGRVSSGRPPSGRVGSGGVTRPPVKYVARGAVFLSRGWVCVALWLLTPSHVWMRDVAS